MPLADRAQLHTVAQQFEAIFLRQMLSAARNTGVGDTLLGNQGTDTFRQMRDDQFADIAAKTGTFGLAQVLEAQLAKVLPTPKPKD